MNDAIRPFQPSDLKGILSVLADAMPADPISEARFTRQVLLDANFRADGAPVAVRDGKIVGFCLALALIEFARQEFPGDWVRVVREAAGRILQGDSPTRLIAAIDDKLNDGANGGANAGGNGGGKGGANGGAIVGFSHYDNERFGP